MSSHFSMRTPLGHVRGLGSARSGTQHFWLQRVTAVANVVLAAAFVGQPRQAQAGLAKALTTGDQPVLWRWAEPFIAKAAK